MNGTHRHQLFVRMPACEHITRWQYCLPTYLLIIPGCHSVSCCRASSELYGTLAQVKSFRKKDSALGAPVFIASKSLGRTNSGVAKLATLMENVGPARFDDNGNIPQHPATHQPHSPPAYDTDSSEYSSSEEGEEDNDDGRSHGQPASPSEQPSAASSRHVSQFEAAGQPRMYGAAAAFAPKSKGGKQYAEPAGDKVRDGLQSPATLPGAVEDNSEGEAGP